MFSLICPNQYSLCHSEYQSDSNFCCLFNFSAKRLKEVSWAPPVSIISSQMEGVLTEAYRDRLQLRSPRGEIWSPPLTNKKVSNPQIFFSLVLSLKPSLGGLLFNLIFLFVSPFSCPSQPVRQAAVRGCGALITDIGSILHLRVSFILSSWPHTTFSFSL